MSANPRTCVGCRTRDDRSHLVRVVAENSAAIVDEQAVMPGRGAWIHPGCLGRALGAKAFDRALRTPGIDVAVLRAWWEDRMGGTCVPPQTENEKAGRKPMGTR